VSNSTLAQTKTILSWFVAFVGLAVCEYRLILAGVDGVDGIAWDHLLAGTIHVLGPGVFGLLALRDRRWAAFCFLVCGPVVAFVMAYPASGVWERDGESVGYYLPPIWLAIDLTVLFFAPLVLVAFATGKRVFYGFPLWAIAATTAFFPSNWTPLLLKPLFAWSASYLGFGAFWLVTARLGWPRLQVSWPKSRTRRFALGCTLILVAAVVDVAGMLAWVASHSSTWRPDCSGYRLPTIPFNSSHAVFTALVIRTGHSVRAIGKSGGSWAIGVVEQRYWGVPSWKPQFVLLTGSWFVEDETFLISGYRAEGLLTRFLPIVSTQYCAVGADPIAEAEIPLRLLNDPSTPIQIIGQVRSPKRMAPALAYNDLSRAFDPSQRPYVPLAASEFESQGAHGL